MVIPHFVVLLFYGVAALVVAVISWFAILLLGRYPKGLFGFQVGFLRYLTRVRCYAALLTDRFPPFGGGTAGDDYPIQVDVDEPERLSRLTTFFRYPLSIPAGLVGALLLWLENLLSFAAWFIILFTGRLPQGMFEVMELPQRFNARLGGYYPLLVTDRSPWFQSETEPTVPERSWNEPLPPLEGAGT